MNTQETTTPREMTSREVGQGLWTLDYPQRSLGMDFGGRTTIFRLPSGGLALHSPGAMKPEQAAEIEALGPVEVLIAPNLMHHVHIGAASARWPEARVLAPEGLREKRPELRIDEVMAPSGELGPDVAWLRVEGMPRVNEHVFLHRVSGTLVLTDLCFNFQDHPHWWLRLVMRLQRSYGTFGPSRLLRSTIADPAATRRSIDALLAWSWDAIALAHGQSLPSGGHEALRRAFAFLT